MERKLTEPPVRCQGPAARRTTPPARWRGQEGTEEAVRAHVDNPVDSTEATARPTSPRHQCGSRMRRLGVNPRAGTSRRPARARGLRAPQPPRRWTAHPAAADVAHAHRPDRRRRRDRGGPVWEPSAAATTAPMRSGSTRPARRNAAAVAAAKSPWTDGTPPRRGMAAKRGRECNSRQPTRPEHRSRQVPPASGRAWKVVRPAVAHAAEGMEPHPTWLRSGVQRARRTSVAVGVGEDAIH